MRIEQLMTKEVATVRPDESLEAAAQLMWDRDCGALPVTEDDGSGRVVAMVTDRDICMASHFSGRPLREIPVREAMSKGVVTCGPSDDLAVAEAEMRRSQVRRLPVVDAAGQILGIVTLADLARECAREEGAKKRDVRAADVSSTLSAICG